MRSMHPSGQSVLVTAAPGARTRLRNAIAATKTAVPNWVIRYAFYGFVFSLPFEAVDIGIAATLPKLFGLALAGLALLKPQLCYKLPPRAFSWFVVYAFGYAVHGTYLILSLPHVPDIATSILAPLRTLVQLLILFWISYNLMKHERIVNGVFWAFAMGTLGLAVLQVVGVTGNIHSEGRVSAFEANPNIIATVLSLGLLALVSLGYGREKYDWKGRLLFWLASGIICVAVVQTGSRGALVGLVASLSVLFLRGKSIIAKIKLGVIAVAAIILLALASYQIDAVRKRWELTIYEGNLSGREEIFGAAVGMILEKPLLGWGPVYHTRELGARLGLPSRDEHNLYLWLLAEGGIVGAFPFFVALWLCWRTAWRARYSIQGFMPAIMLSFVLIISLKGTPILIKFFWVVLSYGLASGSYVPFPKRATALPYPLAPRFARRGVGLRPTKTLTRPVRTGFGVPRRN